MKQSVKTGIGIAGTVIFVVFSLYFCWRQTVRINPNQVECIRFSNSTGAPLTPEETEQFIKLYNKAKYRGTTPNGETTPIYSFTVYYRDGRSFQISENGDSNFSVSYRVGEGGKHFFVDSAELDRFALEIMNQ